MRERLRVHRYRTLGTSCRKGRQKGGAHINVHTGGRYLQSLAERADAGVVKRPALRKIDAKMKRLLLQQQLTARI